jgi:large subunit ribosomal protein L13
MKTYSPKASEIERRWWVVDAEGQTLGRLASVVATRLRGKDKPTFAPHMDGGDFVIVVNASRVQVTGRKLEQKKYYRHSGYPGGMTTTSLEQELAKHPERVVAKAVRGMLPKNSLGEHVAKKLKVYAGPDHPHSAQQPETWHLTPDLTGSTGGTGGAGSSRVEA